MIASLKALRQSCLDTIANIDALLAEAPEELRPDQVIFPMLVKDRCAGITQHALDRYRERTGSKKSDEKIINQIAGRIACADEWELKPKFRIIEMMAHGVHASYYKHGDMLFVIENETCVTMHTAQADRWMLKQNA